MKDRGIRYYIDNIRVSMLSFQFYNRPRSIWNIGTFNQKYYINFYSGFDTAEHLQKKFVLNRPVVIKSEYEKYKEVKSKYYLGQIESMEYVERVKVGEELLLEFYLVIIETKDDKYKCIKCNKFGLDGDLKEKQGYYYETCYICNHTYIYEKDELDEYNKIFGVEDDKITN